MNTLNNWDSKKLMRS